MVASPYWTETDGLYIERRISALGFKHGVTTRALGSMQSAEARARALEAAGLAGDPLTLAQVHGTTICEAGASAPGTAADGWVSAKPGAVVSIYIADCLPIFVWDDIGTAAGVFHSGWRGTAAGMPRAAVRAFRRFGIGPERLSAAIGPRIGACCYAVGPEVAEKFPAKTMTAGKLDLGEAARLQLVESGIAAERVSVAAACTSCSQDLFSYRRDKRGDRMLAFIALPGGH